MEAKKSQFRIHAFDRMIEERGRRGKLDGGWNMGTTGIDVFHWWMEDGIMPGQISLDEYAELMSAGDGDVLAAA